MKCCGLDTVWVENVPGKGYNYCRECRTEAFAPAIVVLEEPTYEFKVDDYYSLVCPPNLAPAPTPAPVKTQTTVCHGMTDGLHVWYISHTGWCCISCGEDKI